MAIGYVFCFFARFLIYLDDILYLLTVIISFEPGNTGKQAILMSWEPGNMFKSNMPSWDNPAGAHYFTSPQAGALNLIVYTIFWLLSILGRFLCVFHMEIESGWVGNSPGYI